MSASPSSLVDKIGSLQNLKEFAELHWSGNFEQYLDVVRKNPTVARSAFQRVYDMVLSYGQEEYIDNKKRLVRYNFFKDEQHGGRDAIFGLDIPLMRLVNVFKSAAERYGTERRVILLHGPVGSSKSTIARLLKRGMEEYSRRPEGALYTYDWILPKELHHGSGAHERGRRRQHLPEDRRVRLGQPSARLQLRRRVLHRQPAHHRVHRGAEAGRGLPLRPAGRLAGAQDQPQQVRPHRHRRHHPGPRR